MRRGIRQDLTKEFILSKVSQEMIMAKYMGIPVSVVNDCVENNVLICSPLRVDNHPTFGFAFNKNHKLKACDFNGSFFGDCFDLVAYVLSFKTGRHINVANKADFYYVLKHIAYTFRKIIYDGEVDAIIYNSAYSNIIKEQYSTFTKDTKVIYKHNIVVEIESDTSDESVTKPFAVYLSGIDTNGDITEQGRSDVNIVAVVNPTSHQVLLITTPRDYYVPIPGVSGGQDDKLTHAGIYGVDVSMQTLEALYDTDIEFFGRVNFTSMTSVVDALGGLDVESDLEFDTGWESGAEIHVNEGMNHFDGISALAFCRERQALPDGDNGRGVHQQAVITAIIKKMMSPAMLRGASDIIESVSDGVDTNFTSSQIQSLIKTQLRTNAKWNIYSVAADGTGGTDICYSSGNEELYVTYPDEDSVAEIIGLIKKVKDGEIIEGSVSTE